MPRNKLSEQERRQVLKTLNQPDYRSLPPSQIVPKLADQGMYLASESTMYRILKEAGQLNHRGNRQKPTRREPTTHVATGPNQVWMWDITWLRGPIQGVFFYLYLVQDLYSRKVVAWEVHETESGEHAKVLIQKAIWREKVAGQPIVLHADNGSPMKAATLLETLRNLGLMPSYSRPRVSNDNAYVERLFGTMKYRPRYPKDGFSDLTAARAWVLAFLAWYNELHQHRAIGYLTPGQRHRGEAETILKRRRVVYERSKQAHPERWIGGKTRAWALPESVTLNPTRPSDLATTREHAA